MRIPDLVAAVASVAGFVSLAAPTWTDQSSGVTATFRGVSAASDRIAWVSGSGSTVLRTEDGGATWTRLQVTADRVDFRDVDATGPRTAYLLSIGNGATSRIYRTTDAGATWTEQYRAPDQQIFLDAMSFWDDAHGIVLGDSIEGAFLVMVTDDAGQTWTRVPPSALPPALPNEGGFAASGTNIAVVGAADAWIGTGSGPKARVLHTADRGKTWTAAETPLPSGQSSGIFSVAFRDAQHGVVVGGDYTKEQDATDNAAVTTDGGKTWTLVGQHGLSGFRSVVAHVPGTTAAFFAVGPQGSDWSDDDGRTWTPVSGPGFHTFSFAPGGTVGWGAGARGRVARWGQVLPYSVAAGLRDRTVSAGAWPLLPSATRLSAVAPRR